MLRRISRCARLCENTVHGSTRLTTNGLVSLEIEYLSVRPEHRRRAPKKFLHSLPQGEIFLRSLAFARDDYKDLRPFPTRTSINFRECCMSKPKLTIALSHYDRHVPFFDGTVQPEAIDLNVLIVGQSDRQRNGEERHERMLQQGEFDVAELSLSSYLMAKSRGMPFTAIPVFPRRLFSLSQMWVNIEAGIERPIDLVGKKVGLHSFQNTLATLSKGDLQSEFEVPWRKIHWVLNKKDNIPFEPEKGVKIDQLADGTDAGKLLESGEISAMMTPHPPKPVLRGSSKIRRLFEDPKAEDLRYYTKNGFFPIMHVVAFKDEVLKKFPEAAQDLFD